MSSFNGSDALNNYLASHDSYQDFLEHHGIKGMKWGIRRFQNADGSYTEAGKKRYGTGDGSHTRSSRSAKSAISSDPTLSAMDNDYLGANSSRKVSREDATAAAKLGLKALMKTRPNENFDPDDKLYQDWFLNEDQTFGLPTAANFVNKGYSAEDIKKFFKTVSENADYDSDDYSNYFDIMESGYNHDPGKLDKFIDECVSIRKSEQKKQTDRAAAADFDGDKVRNSTYRDPRTNYEGDLGMRWGNKNIDLTIATGDKALHRIDRKYGKLQEKSAAAYERGDMKAYNKYMGKQEALTAKSDAVKQRIADAVLPYLGKEDTPANRINMRYEYEQRKKNRR